MLTGHLFLKIKDQTKETRNHLLINIKKGDLIRLEVSTNGRFIEFFVNEKKVNKPGEGSLVKKLGDGNLENIFEFEELTFSEYINELAKRQLKFNHYKDNCFKQHDYTQLLKKMLE